MPKQSAPKPEPVKEETTTAKLFTVQLSEQDVHNIITALDVSVRNGGMGLAEFVRPTYLKLNSLLKK